MYISFIYLGKKGFGLFFGYGLLICYLLFFRVSYWVFNIMSICTLDG